VLLPEVGVINVNELGVYTFMFAILNEFFELSLIILLFIIYYIVIHKLLLTI
jgi:hypothetical protein